MEHGVRRDLPDLQGHLYPVHHIVLVKEEYPYNEQRYGQYILVSEPGP